VPDASRDVVEVAGTFRRGRSALLVGVVANLALAVIFLGVPWWRERGRVLEARARFAEFAACLYGGRVQPEPGLGLPPGDTAFFAARALEGPADWPARCRPALLVVAPEYARFLLPSAAVAEEDVRRAVGLARRELDAFAATRTRATRLSTRPLRAVAVLRGKLAAMVVASGFHEGLDDDAIALDPAGALREPSRLPLHAAADGPLHLEARADGLVAFSLDARGLGVVRLAAGSVDARRVVRPRGVQSAVPGVPERASGPASTVVPWLVSATSEPRCAEDPLRCARRSTGLAPIAVEATRAPAPTLVAAHPWGGAEAGTLRVLASTPSEPGARVRMLARTVDGGLALRTFAMVPDTASAPAATAVPPSRGEGREPTEVRAPITERLLFPDVAPVRAATLTADGAPLVLVAGADALELQGFPSDTDASRLIASGPGVDEAALWTCGAGEATWVAFGGDAGFRMVRITDDSAGGAVVARDLPAAPFDRPRVRIACDTDGALLVAPLRNGGVRLLACPRDGACRTSRLDGPTRGARMAVARDGGRGVVAWAAPGSAVHVARVGAGAAPVAEARVPAACWDDDTGLCGAPTLAARNGRFVLVTREGTDLRVLESLDAGATWSALAGLR
jgi:hypothetical protein